jgi:carboxypeptidase Q
VSSFRSKGAIEAARYGAVGVVIRSLTPISLSTPHTGSMRPYPDDIPHIPAICCTTEDAEVMARLTRQGIVLKLHMTLGAHMDSW